jgi:AcrR family transcriptional regulator
MLATVTFLCQSVKAMDDGHGTPTGDRILDATRGVLGRAGPRRLSLSDVAIAAGVSRPTLYRWFSSKEALLEAFGAYEQAHFDAGLAAAIAGLDKAERLEAVLRFIVEFQQMSSLRVVVAVEPEYVLREMARVLPITRDRLLPHFPGPDGLTVASIVTRIALSHALVPDDDPDLFLDELRRAAGLAGARTRPGRRRSAQRTRSRKARARGR